MRARASLFGYTATATPKSRNLLSKSDAYRLRQQHTMRTVLCCNGKGVPKWQIAHGI